MAGSTAEAAEFARRLLKHSERTATYAPWRDRQRFRRLVKQGGLPGRRDETWRFTNISHWYATALEEPLGAADIRLRAPAGVEVLEFGAPGAKRLVDWRGAAVVDPAEHPLAAVNGLLLGAGVAVRVPAGVALAEPVVVERLGAAYQHVLVVVEDGATLELVEAPSKHAHRVVECVVGAGGRLVHKRRQLGADARECNLIAARVGAQGHYTLSQVASGGALRRNDVAVVLAGTGAEAMVFGAWRLDGDQHLDNQVQVRHVAGAGRSRQIYRGVAGGNSRAVLCGGIHIAPGANGTDAVMDSKNLLASPAARVYAKPALQIHASDVKCGHGATVGRLDDNAILYLRSRGVAEADARALLVRGFLSEAVVDDAGAAQLELRA